MFYFLFVSNIHGTSRRDEFVEVLFGLKAETRYGYKILPGLTGACAPGAGGSNYLPRLARVRELRKANDILCLASAFFAQAKLDHRFKS